MSLSKRPTQYLACWGKAILPCASLSSTPARAILVSAHLLAMSCLVFRCTALSTMYPYPPRPGVNSLPLPLSSRCDLSRPSCAWPPPPASLHLPVTKSKPACSVPLPTGMESIHFDSMYVYSKDKHSQGRAGDHVHGTWCYGCSVTIGSPHFREPLQCSHTRERHRHEEIPCGHTEGGGTRRIHWSCQPSILPNMAVPADDAFKILDWEAVFIS